MAGDLDDGDLEVGEGAAAADLGKANAGLVLYCPNSFSKPAWGHIGPAFSTFFFEAWLCYTMMILIECLNISRDLMNLV